MFAFIITLLIVLSVLLIILILIQNPKGGGLSGEISSSSAGQMFGVAKTTDIVEKLTWGFSISIMVLVLISGFTISKTDQGIEPITIQQSNSKPVPVAPAPVSPAPAPASAPASAPITPAPAK